MRHHIARIALLCFCVFICYALWLLTLALLNWRPSDFLIYILSALSGISLWTVMLEFYKLSTQDVDPSNDPAIRAMKALLPHLTREQKERLLAEAKRMQKQRSQED